MQNVKLLDRNFYSRDTHVVAKKLLGKLLVRQIGRKKIVGRICEVESYIGENDKACHASKGRTPRTEVMYGEAGHAYVYMIYGMYYCLNIVTERVDFPAAVLIRGAVLVSDLPQPLPRSGRGQALLKKGGLVQYSPLRRGSKRGFWEKGTISGPGKLCRALSIDRKLNGHDLTLQSKLYVAGDRYVVHKKDILITPRINVDYAGEDTKLPWRYLLRQ